MDGYELRGLNEEYEVDCLLRRFGFVSRVAFEDRKQRTFALTFATAHVAFYAHRIDMKTAITALERFRRWGSQLPPLQGNIQTLYDICLGFLNDEPHFPANFSENLRLLRSYAIVLQEVLTGNARGDNFLQKASELWHVQVVLFVHAETSVSYSVGLVPDPAPVLYLEQYENMFSILNPADHSRFLRVMSAKEVNSTLEAVMSGKGEAAKEEFEELSDREIALYKLLSIHSEILQLLLPALSESSYSFPKKVIEKVKIALNTSKRVARDDMQPLEALGELLRVYKAKELTQHEWEHCEFYSENVTQLPCGHRLCKEHLRELRDRCPWRCRDAEVKKE